MTETIRLELKENGRRIVELQARDGHFAHVPTAFADDEKPIRKVAAESLAADIPVLVTVSRATPTAVLSVRDEVPRIAGDSEDTLYEAVQRTAAGLVVKVRRVCREAET